MGIITLSLDDHVESVIRKAAARKYGHRKGALKEFVSEATKQYVKNEQVTSDREDEIAARQLSWSSKGFNIGYKYVKRETLWGIK